MARSVVPAGAMLAFLICSQAMANEIEHATRNWTVHEVTLSVPRPSSPALALLTQIADWLVDEFGLPRSDELPAVKLVSQATLAALRAGGSNLQSKRSDAAEAADHTVSEPGQEVEAVYVNATRTIYLREEWSGRTHAEMSVLVHEMVHHLQNLGGQKFECAGAQEEPAFLAQGRWLERYGLTLESEFGLDRLTQFLRSKCFW